MSLTLGLKGLKFINLLKVHFCDLSFTHRLPIFSFFSGNMCEFKGFFCLFSCLTILHKKLFSYSKQFSLFCRGFPHVFSTDLMSFDELSSTSEKLSHPTANRPKMPGRRLPAQFGGGHSVSSHRVRYS